MSSRHYPSVPLLGTCTAIWRDDKILLAQRTAGPSIGSWAMPGGLVEVGETMEDAARREVVEETALVIEQLAFNRVFEIISRDEKNAVERHYVLVMFVAKSTSGTAIAGDDAGDVKWCTLADLETMQLTGRTLDYAHASRALLSQLD